VTVPPNILHKFTLVAAALYSGLCCNHNALLIRLARHGLRWAYCTVVARPQESFVYTASTASENGIYLLYEHRSRIWNIILRTSVKANLSFPSLHLNILMATLWNPRELLGVDPDGPFTCVGTTQKGVRCRNFYISGSDLSRASNLLDRMATSDPWDARAHLSNLAELTLCPRWHRKPGYSQVESMKRKWWSIIIFAYPEPLLTRPISVTSSTSERLSRNTRSVSGSTSSTSASRSLPTPPASPSPAPRLRSVTSASVVMRRPTLTANHTSTEPLRSRTDSTARQRASSSVSASPSVRSTATPAALLTPPQSPRQAPAQTRNENSSTSSDATVPAAVTTPPPTHRRTSRSQGTELSNVRLPLTPERPIRPTPCTHSSRRKTITDECPVCNDDMHCLDDAVWCRSQCGTNIHRNCFALWRQACLDREAIVTCVFCRAPWKYEWEE
jgi:hypothetical protein